ncbi:MAG: hypothetical protein HKN20_12840 [Gemmatimonadetes bacterium]|nr:hypothetical protein [Gemmatimonadota bacterium]
MKVLNLDIDAFVTPIALYRGPDDGRLSETDYSCWTPDRLGRYLEDHCGLSRARKTMGCIVTQHDELFPIWRSLIASGDMDASVHLYHLDAHDDLGGGLDDESHEEVQSRVLLKPVESRPHVPWEKMNSGNYLLYALACRWISALTLIRHPEDFQSVPRNLLSDDGARIHLQPWSQGAPVAGASREPSIPLDVIPIDDFTMRDEFAWVFVATSPAFTPPAADALTEVVREYLDLTGEILGLPR